MTDGPDYHYRFDLPDGRLLEFDVRTQGGARTLSERIPDWCALTYHQCPSCPLSDARVAHCPAAVGLIDIVQACQDMASITEVDVTVVARRRTYRQTTDMQTALRSLIGLIMPTSGCPVLGGLEGLAQFHLPFADRDETVFRVVGAYLLEQYLIQSDGGVPDWELKGVRALYGDLQTVDRAFAERMRSVTSGDASVNALVALFSLATLVSMSLDDDLRRVRGRLMPGV